MSTKNKIIEILEKNRGKSISGEEIAGVLGVSRCAVWKAIKTLEQDGYCIEACTNKGYTLSSDNNILSVSGLLPYLSDEAYAKKIFVYDTLESTNKTAKEMAVNGHEHGTVIIADTQTHGRGRRGRSFYSPCGSGLYLSIILRSEFLDLPSKTLITSAVAVAVCRAVKAVTGKEASIKWVNDILLDGKKICGILTEAVTDFESGGIDWIVTGMGININTTDFPNEISQRAASIFEGTPDSAVRSRLAAELINIFLSDGAWLGDVATYKEYKERLTMLGKTITVFHGDETYDALALDVDETGRLIVKKEDGTIAALSSGEVSTKQSGID